MNKFVAGVIVLAVGIAIVADKAIAQRVDQVLGSTIPASQTVAGSISSTTCPGTGCVSITFTSPVSSIVVDFPTYGGPDTFVTEGLIIGTSTWQSWPCSFIRIGTGTVSAYPGLQFTTFFGADNSDVFTCSGAGLGAFRIRATVDDTAPTLFTITGFSGVVFGAAPFYIAGTGTGGAADVDISSRALRVSLYTPIQAAAFGNGDSAGNNDIRVTVANDSTGRVNTQLTAVTPFVAFSCFVPSTATITTECRVAPSASLRAYVTSFAASNAAATVQTLDIIYGTGTACATSPVALTHKWQMGTNATTTSPHDIAVAFTTPLVPALANAICVRPSAATAFGATITGFLAP